MANLVDVLIDIGQAGIEQQGNNGAMPPGHNGVYHDPETPVRNTSHWLIMFLKLYELTEKSVFLEAAVGAKQYLTSQEARPMNGAFWHRKNPEKDFCNGLVGQAWTIEALVAFSRLTNDSETLALAHEVFVQHPFNERLGVWRRLSVDGSYLDYDITFNHQLWFAAAGALLASLNNAAKDSIQVFLDRLDRNFSIYPSGLVFHRLVVPELLSAKAKVKMLLAKRKYKDTAYHKAIGYHSFNTYGFSLIKSMYPEHSFWQSGKLIKTVAYLHREEYVQGLEDNRYAYPYNPPGFEIPYSYYLLDKQDDVTLLNSTQKWVSKQFRRHYNSKSKQMDQNSPDPDTQTARVYELLRMPKHILENVNLDESIVS